MKDYKLKISQFIDNELSVDEQQELFRFLAENQEARETLADYMEMKSEAKSYYAGMNVEMDNSKVLAAGVFTPQKNMKKYRTMFYFSAAAAILFAFMFLFNQFKQNPILTKYQNLQSEMINLQEDYTVVLNRQVELIKLNNQLYAETEKLKTAPVAMKSKPVKKVSGEQSPKIKKEKNNKQKRSHTTANSGRMLALFQNVQTIEITKNDFLGGQVIGN